MPSLCEVMTRAGKICGHPVPNQQSFCKRHTRMEQGASEPRVEGKCVFLDIHKKRCSRVSDTNGYCGFHQIDTIKYRGCNCGPNAICGCISPGVLRQWDIEEKHGRI